MIILAGIASSVQAQFSFNGQVLDIQGKALPYATAVLLKPADSTLAYFGITNDKGLFVMNHIQKGNYLLQVAFIGYQTYYSQVSIPEKAGDYGVIILKEKSLELSSAEVRSEYIPIVVKKDTLEYNAAAFKTKPDAVAEDLLRKLPGVEVDRSGNIKAMGENVQNVMVDGKEFFSADPKVATKNLPADAIQRVQVYDKKSESAELSGMDDGSREKTINLLLKDGKKQAWLGDLSAGAGTAEKYAASAKVYRFTRKNQFAMLGMLNNINRFGFSFQDYLDFNGGLPSLMGNGSMRISISSEDELPVNFGQTVDGLVTSGAGGLNYSTDLKANSRIYASYLGSGTDRSRHQSVYTRYYMPGGDYEEDEESMDNNRNFSHRLTMGWKDKSDSSKTLLFNGNLGITQASGDNWSRLQTLLDRDPVSEMESKAASDRSGISGAGSFSFMKKGRGALKLTSIGANASYNHSLSNSDRLNILQYTGIEGLIRDHQFRNRNTERQQFGISLSNLIRLGKRWYLEPVLNAHAEADKLKREQGLSGDAMMRTDSLSPQFNRTSLRLTPGVKFRWNYKKLRLVPGLSVALANSANSLNSGPDQSVQYSRILPSLSWEIDYKPGNRLSLDFSSSVSEPNLEFLLPVPDNANPLSIFFGNCNLKPETRYNLFATWLMFDQFSQTSIFSQAGGTITRDKIGYSRNVSQNLAETIHLLNTSMESELNGNVDFSTPLKMLKINIHASLDARWTRGITYVNGEENKTSQFSRSARLSFDNSKKEKWDLDLGAELTFTNAGYSLQQSLDNKYLSWNYWAEIGFDPGDHWHFGITADVIGYNSGSFNTGLSIPLIHAEMSYRFLQNQRGSISLEVFDLLDKNQSISRINEMNYLREVRSDIIRRYGMLSFKYRLNKAAKSRGGIDIEMRKR